MDQPQVGFRELTGVEPTVETLLHDAGVGTWEALSKVLDAFSRLSGQSLPALGLEELASQVAARCAITDGDPAAGSPEGETAGAPQGAGEAPDDEPVATSRHHRVVLDAGKTIGGIRRDIALTVSTAALADVDVIAYSASLVAHPMGRAADEQSPWVSPSGQVGRAEPPAPLRLVFGDVALPVGIHRLQVRLAVTLPEPAPAPLPLEPVLDDTDETATRERPVGVGS